MVFKKVLTKYFTLIFNSNRTLTEKLRTLFSLITTKAKKVSDLRIVIVTKPPRFSGWGITSNHRLPWDSKSSDETGLKFIKANAMLLDRLNTGEVIYGGGYESDGYENLLRSLSWRHYICYWTAKFAAEHTQTKKVNIVEAGVWYGMSVTYAISALQDSLGVNSNFEAFLYDAWEGMKEENLTANEKSSRGKYSYLSMEQAQNNLRSVSPNCTFIKGHIPEILSTRPGPSELSWLHIDLNSSIPTLRTLEHFVPRLLSGGLVLFDDYAHWGFKETRKVADEYCKQVNGLLLPLPTGQAIFFKH